MQVHWTMHVFFHFPWCLKGPIFCCSVENLLILVFTLSPKNSDTTCVFYWYIFHFDLDETPNTHDFFKQTPTKGLVPHFCKTLSEEHRCCIISYYLAWTLR